MIGNIELAMQVSAKFRATEPSNRWFGSLVGREPGGVVIRLWVTLTWAQAAPPVTPSLSWENGPSDRRDRLVTSPESQDGFHELPASVTGIRFRNSLPAPEAGDNNNLMDGGRGLLHLGDGRGGLRALAGRASGIKAYGEQRGAAWADYEGDGRPDLVLSQNDTQTRRFHNRRAEPALRLGLRGPKGNPDALGTSILLRALDGRLRSVSQTVPRECDRRFL